MLVVLSEESTHPTSINARENKAIIEAARIFGCRIIPIHTDFANSQIAEALFAHLPIFEPNLPGVWVGYIPAYEQYATIYDAALKHGIQLVNSPEQFQMAMEFDHFYSLLADLTPKSIILESLETLANVPLEISFPVFIKGAIQSEKTIGINACVASNVEELSTIARNIFKKPRRSRGKIVVREYVKLRRLGMAPNGFPISREYRVFTFRQVVLAFGFYWEGFSVKPPTPQEQSAILSLALEAAKRVRTPFMAIDIGQLESGEWIVIEVGDGQFCGLSQIPVLELWSKLKDIHL